jgi:hypothetical protein
LLLELEVIVVIAGIGTMEGLKKRAESRRSDSRYLPPVHTIYLFRCGESGLYAFTADPKGHILPSEIYPRVLWRFEQPVTLRLERNSPKRQIAKAVLNAIARHGFHLAHAAINAELLAFATQHYDSAVAPRSNPSNRTFPPKQSQSLSTY